MSALMLERASDPAAYRVFIDDASDKSLEAPAFFATLAAAESYARQQLVKHAPGAVAKVSRRATAPQVLGDRTRTTFVRSVTLRRVPDGIEEDVGGAGVTAASPQPSPARCPVPGCGRGRSDGHLMCRPHWLSVPAAMQRAVWDALRRWQRYAGSIEALRAAQGAAIRSVTPKGAQHG